MVVIAPDLILGSKAINVPLSVITPRVRLQQKLVLATTLRNLLLNASEWIGNNIYESFVMECSSNPMEQPNVGHELLG